MTNDFRKMFETLLLENGEQQKLDAFREAANKLSGDWIKMQLFAFNALCNFKGTPNNNGTSEWAAYVATGSIEEWKKVREQRLKKEAAKEQVV